MFNKLTEKTQAQLINEALDADIVNTHNFLISVLNNTHNALWASSTTTPQEILAERGTEATKLFVVSDLLKSFIQDVHNALGTPDELRPDLSRFVVPSNYTVGYNQDGTVTVTLITENL